MIKIVKSKNSGFTLVEVTIVLFLFIAISGVLFALFEWHAKIFGFQQVQVQVVGSARSVMNALQGNILPAYRVVASRSVGGVNYNSGSSVLVLQLPSHDSNGDVVANKWDYMAFSLGGNSLTQATEADAASSRKSGTKTLSEKINSLTFTYDSATFDLVRKVSADIETSGQFRGQQISTRLQQDFYLRNY